MAARSHDPEFDSFWQETVAARDRAVCRRAGLEAAACRQAAMGGELSLLEDAHARGFVWDASACRAAAEVDSLECLMYLRDHGCPWDPADIAWDAGKACYDYIATCAGVNFGGLRPTDAKRFNALTGFTLEAKPAIRWDAPFQGQRLFARGWYTPGMAQRLANRGIDPDACAIVQAARALGCDAHEALISLEILNFGRSAAACECLGLRLTDRCSDLEIPSARGRRFAISLTDAWLAAHVAKYLKYL